MTFAKILKKCSKHASIINPGTLKTNKKGKGLHPVGEKKTRYPRAVYTSISDSIYAQNKNCFLSFLSRIQGWKRVKRRIFFLSTRTKKIRDSGNRSNTERKEIPGTSNSPSIYKLKFAQVDWKFKKSPKWWFNGDLPG